MKKTLKLGVCAIALSLVACNGSNNNTSTTTTVDSAAMTTAPAGGNMTQDSGNRTGNGMANNGMTDQDFVTRASAMNIAEINAHKAAATHAVTADVKMHAKHM